MPNINNNFSWIRNAVTLASKWVHVAYRYQVQYLQDPISSKHHRNDNTRWRTDSSPERISWCNTEKLYFVTQCISVSHSTMTINSDYSEFSIPGTYAISTGQESTFPRNVVSSFSGLNSLRLCYVCLAPMMKALWSFELQLKVDIAPPAPSAHESLWTAVCKQWRCVGVARYLEADNS